MASQAPPRPSHDPVGDVGLPGQLRPRRSPRLVAAGLLVACLGGLGGAVAFQQATHANQVVVARHTLMRGSTVGADDLSVVTIGQVPGVRTVPASQLSSLLGKQTLVDVPAGSLVGPDSMGTSDLPRGSAQLGLKLAVGRIPNGSLPPGSAVQLVPVTEKDAGPGSAAPPIGATVLTTPEHMADGATRSLDVAVPASEAGRVAELAAHDRLVVVRLGDG